jgi:hypothetical protein
MPLQLMLAIAFVHLLDEDHAALHTPLGIFDISLVAAVDWL